MPLVSWSQNVKLNQVELWTTGAVVFSWASWRSYIHSHTVSASHGLPVSPPLGNPWPQKVVSEEKCPLAAPQHFHSEIRSTQFLNDDCLNLTFKWGAFADCCMFFGRFKMPVLVTSELKHFDLFGTIKIYIDQFGSKLNCTLHWRYAFILQGIWGYLFI